MQTMTLPRRTYRPPHPFRVLLLSAGVTVTDAAKALAVSRPLLSAVLHGHRPASTALAARMADLETAMRREQDNDGVDNAHP